MGGIVRVASELRRIFRELGTGRGVAIKRQSVVNTTGTKLRIRNPDRSLPRIAPLSEILGVTAIRLRSSRVSNSKIGDLAGRESENGRTVLETFLGSRPKKLRHQTPKRTPNAN